MPDRKGLLLHMLLKTKFSYVLFDQRLYLHTPKVKCCLSLNIPRYDKKYIDKTDHNLVTRLNEQGSPDDQPMYQHLSKCEYYNNIVNLMKLPGNDSTTAVIDKRE